MTQENSSPEPFVDGYAASAMVTIRPTRQFQSLQGLPNFDGVSAETAGARGICMHMVVFPPGVEANAHYHDGFETAIYILEGNVETRYGHKLEQVVVNGPGDFIFIPPGVPHQPRNLSQTGVARAIVSRNDAREQESVVLYDPAG